MINVTLIPIIPQVNGEILTHSIELGDYVAKGDQISSIDDEIYALQEKNAKTADNILFLFINYLLPVKTPLMLWEHE